MSGASRCGRLALLTRCLGAVPRGSAAVRTLRRDRPLPGSGRARGRRRRGRGGRRRCRRRAVSPGPGGGRRRCRRRAVSAGSGGGRRRSGRGGRARSDRTSRWDRPWRSGRAAGRRGRKPGRSGAATAVGDGPAAGRRRRSDVPVRGAGRGYLDLGGGGAARRLLAEDQRSGWDHEAQVRQSDGRQVERPQAGVTGETHRQQADVRGEADEQHTSDAAGQFPAAPGVVDEDRYGRKARDVFGLFHFAPVPWSAAMVLPRRSLSVRD